nr:hypothetical protein SHINE37_100142 [Rhizobiaceae bacterium]
MRWRPITMASRIRNAIRSGDRTPTEMQAKGGYGRLLPLPRQVSLISRFDRPPRLMKEGKPPLNALPMEEGASPRSRM